MQLDLNRKILSDIVFFDKYARYLDDKKRRETYEECIDRNKAMHLKKFPQLEIEIERAYKKVYEKKVLPSMRSLQFAGKAIELNNMRLYNCCFHPINDIHSFSETMLLLLGGTGVGYSVQQHHIQQLPTIKKVKKEYKYLVQDSIEGWADAIKILMRAYFEGKTKPRFDFSHIRQKGSRLITSGGKAPGPEPLKICLAHIEAILANKEIGTKLTSLEVHSILCHIADAVLAGGIRRAAMIAFFDNTDMDMIYCKSGNWFELNPHFGRANNSAVFLRGRDTEETYREFIELIKHNGTGEPAIFWTNDLEMLSNPCVTEDTWITTNEGLQQVKNLIKKDITLLINGKQFKTKSNGFFKTGTKAVFELSTEAGYKVKATSNHKILTSNRGWVELKNLVPAIDEIVLHKHRNQNISLDTNSESYKKGYIVGATYGDGWINDTLGQVAIWNNSYTNPNGIKKELENSFEILKTRSDFKGFHKHGEQKEEANCVAIKNLCINYFDNNKNLNTENLLIEDKNFIIGFLKGIFDADGSVQGTQSKGVSIRLGSIKIETLESLQILLNSLGIESKIYKNRNGDKPSQRLLPDGKGDEKLYLCQPLHDLVIANDSIVEYNNIIGFADTDKQNLLNKLIYSYKRNPNKSKFTSKVKDIKYIGAEDVYDVTVDTEIEIYQAFDANGIYVHNCVEASLRSFTFCNLCELNGSLIESQEDLDECAWAAAFIGTLQASYTDFHYLRPIWKERTEQDALIGVGITGLANEHFLKLNLEKAATIVNQTNAIISNKIGIRQAARCTLIKPSGTTSLALGCSSGVGDWHDYYYIRRMRIGKNQDLYWYLFVNHPELVEDDIEKPHLQAIVSVPIKAPEGALIRNNNTAIGLLERVKDLYARWIKPGYNRGENSHSISCTINIRDMQEWNDVANWMWDNRETYAGISTLPYDGGTYHQLPFESIDKETYEKLSSVLQEIDLTKIIEENDNTDLTGEQACAGGACLI